MVYRCCTVRKHPRTVTFQPVNGVWRAWRGSLHPVWWSSVVIQVWWSSVVSRHTVWSRYVSFVIRQSDDEEQYYRRSEDDKNSFYDEHEAMSFEEKSTIF
jgi:hypothetical protein